MYFKITYNVNGMKFTANTPYVSEAYDMVKAIIKAEKLMFPDQENAFCNYFEILSKLAFGSLLGHENHIFKIECVGKKGSES